MPNRLHDTEPDSRPARRLALKQWTDATLDPFLKACRCWRDDPERSLEQVRKVLEGWAHAVNVEMNPEFAPFERGQLHRGPIGGNVLNFARGKLPKHLQLVVDHAKEQGNLHHHNQGEILRTNPRIARTTLLQCGEVVTWLYEEVLRQPTPAELRAALRDLDEASATPIAAPPPPRPSSRPWRDALLALAVLVVAGGALGAYLAGRSPFHDASPPPASTVRFELLGQPERMWIEAYQAAIDSRDVDQILARHAFPTRRFFMDHNDGEPRLRRLFQGWFDHAGPTRRTGFDGCTLVGVTDDGSRALRCDTYIDPPFPDAPSRVATCLVFTSEGKVVSRTEIKQVTGCPPP